MDLVGGRDEVCRGAVGEVWADTDAVVGCSAVFTGVHELAGWLLAVLAFSKVPAWLLAWMDAGLSLSVVVERVRSEVELLLLLVVEGVVWGTKTKLTSRGSPLLGGWRRLAELLAHEGHGLGVEQRIALGIVLFRFTLGHSVAWGFAVFAHG